MRRRALSVRLKEEEEGGGIFSPGEGGGGGERATSYEPQKCLDFCSFHIQESFTD